MRANEAATGPARALLLEILDRGHRLVLSLALLDEVERVLHYPRLLKRFGLSEADITSFVAFLSVSAEIVVLDGSITAPIRDPQDVHVVQTAVAGKADYLCTLDRHFHELAVVEFCGRHGIKVISDLELLGLVRSG